MDHFALVVHEQIQCKWGPLRAGGGGGSWGAGRRASGPGLCVRFPAVSAQGVWELEKLVPSLGCRSQRDPAVGQPGYRLAVRSQGFIACSQSPSRTSWPHLWRPGMLFWCRERTRVIQIPRIGAGGGGALEPALPPAEGWSRGLGAPT